MLYDLYLKCCNYKIIVPREFRNRILRNLQPEERESYHKTDDAKWAVSNIPFESIQKISDAVSCTWLIHHFYKTQNNTNAFLLLMLEELLWLLQYVTLMDLSEIRVSDLNPSSPNDELYTYDDLYLDLLSIALCDDDTVFGLDNYQRNTKIHTYGGNICSEDLIRLLNYNEYANKPKSKLSSETIFHLIDFAKFEHSESLMHIRENLKFLHIDRQLLIEIVLEQFDRWLTERYPDVKKVLSADQNLVRFSRYDNESGTSVLIQYQTTSDEFKSFSIERELLSSNCFYLRLLGLERDSNKETTIAELEIQFLDDKGIILIRRIENHSTKPENIHKELKISFEYTNYSEDQFSDYIESISEIIDLPTEHEKAPQIKHGQFKLVYLFGEGIHDLTEHREIYFTNDFVVDTKQAGKIRVVKNAHPIPPVPDDFFGNKIDAIHALIGRNGSGKSSLLELLCSCEVFGAKGFSDDSGKYFLIFQIDDTYYYINNTGRETELDASMEHLQFNEGSGITGDVTVCRISNIFELYDKHHIDIRNSRILDLRTQYLMQHSQNAYEAENLLLKNYQKTIQTAENAGLLDHFHNKMLPDFNQEHYQLNLSSGERARLSLFSRILSVFYVHNDLKDLLRKPKATPYYIFLLDEAELYFHPAWQRGLIADLRNFFNRIAELTSGNPVDFNGVTLILTSNSPFYMSDLPESMIHMLSVNGKQEAFHGKSFGQNIYSLLRDKFFMEDGVIGEFAYKKIQEAISLLKNHIIVDNHWESVAGTLSADDKAKIDYLLTILGDPLMKQILEEMLERKERV